MALSAAIAVGGSVDQSLAVATWIEVYEHLGQPTDYRIRFEVEIGSSDFDQLIDARLDVGSELSIMVPDPAGSQCLVKGRSGPSESISSTADRAAMSRSVAATRPSPWIARPSRPSGPM